MHCLDATPTRCLHAQTRHSGELQTPEAGIATVSVNKQLLPDVQQIQVRAHAGGTALESTPCHAASSILESMLKHTAQEQSNRSTRAQRRVGMTMKLIVLWKKQRSSSVDSR